MSIELDDVQLKAIEELDNGKVLTGDVGSGKSRTSLAYYFLKECNGSLRINGKGDFGPMQSPKDLYIITTAFKRDSLEWEEEAASFVLSHEREISISNVKVTVDSWNNINKYEDIKDAVFIFDEQRLVGNGAWVKGFLKIAKQNRWILLSATPGDNWMDYIPVFLANGFYKNRTEFCRRHVVYSRFSKFPKVDRYIETGALLRLRKRILVDMPVKRHTTRHVSNVLVDHDPFKFETVFKNRWHIYEDRPIRDIAELFLVMRKVVNSDPSRLAKVIELYKKHPRLIIFYNFNYELEELRTLADTLGVPVAERNGHNHDKVPEGDSWVYLVQYTSGAEGWNCTSTDATIFYSLNYSYKINHQAKGRIDRRDTKYTDLYYYIFRSDTMIDKAILKSLAMKKSFNEKEFINRGTRKDYDKAA